MYPFIAGWSNMTSWQTHHIYSFGCTSQFHGRTAKDCEYKLEACIFMGEHCGFVIKIHWGAKEHCRWLKVSCGGTPLFRGSTRNGKIIWIIGGDLRMHEGCSWLNKNAPYLCVGAWWIKPGVLLCMSDIFESMVMIYGWTAEVLACAA